jgi:NosR/NirI family nitrous oxide reductase transcriptional regulator
MKRVFIKQRVERVLGLVALLILILASILGKKQSINDNESSLLSLLKENHHLQENSNNIYDVFKEQNTRASAYIFRGESMAYGGPLEVAVMVDTNIVIQTLIITSHNETPSYVTKVLKQQFIRQIIGKTYTDEFSLESDLDAVTGATYTSRAIADASKEACQKIAEEQKGVILPDSTKNSMKFGLPEILLILLYALSLYGVYSKIKWKKTLRWGIMIFSLLTLGFWLCIPLSLFKINSILLGYWPDWHTGMYWYLLIGGGFLTLLLSNKRVYCTWICPFGAAQSCLGFIGKAKNRLQGRTKFIVLWIQRILAFATIASALYFRNPGTINFEIFGTFFNLTGTTFLFVLTAVYMLSSLFTINPYCHTLCPLTPIEEFILMLKKWMLHFINPNFHEEKN